MPASKDEDETPARDAVLAEADINAVQNADLIRRRRDQICDAALELFLEKGFASTTIRDICARSGVNQASIYDYIANKNDILRRLLNRLWFRRDVTSLPERLKTRDRPLEALLAAHFEESWNKKRKGTLLAYRSVPYLRREDRQQMRAHDRALIEEIAAALRAGHGLAEGDPRVEVIANMLIFLTAFAPMRDWLNAPEEGRVMRDTIAAGAAAMIRQLAATPAPAPPPDGPHGGPDDGPHDGAQGGARSGAGEDPPGR